MSEEKYKWPLRLPSEPTPIKEDNELLNELGEKEVMIQAFDKVRKLFELRSWIMDGRGSYPYNDDRYKEEVRYMYDEFDALQKDVWANIKTKTFEHREKIIAEYLSKQPPLSVGEDEAIYDLAQKNADKYFEVKGEKWMQRLLGFSEGYKAAINTDRRFTLDELKDAFDAGVNNGCYDFIDKNKLSKRFQWADEIPPTKEQYINNLKEKV